MQRSLSAPSPFSPSQAGKTSPILDAGKRYGPVSSPIQSKSFQTKRTWQNLGPLGRAGEELLSSPPIKCGFLLDGTGPLLTGGEEPGSRARLVHHGPSELWMRHSSKHVVRDLLAGYAADPLAPGPRRATCGSQSSSNAVSPRNDPSSVRQCFLERYVRQQAHIESLLRDWKPPPPPVDTEDVEAETEETVEAVVEEVEPEEPEPPQAVDTFLGTEISYPLEVAAKTRNVRIDDDVMTCTERSGGARFFPPAAETFRLCVCSLDPLDTNPFYVGMVPAGADATEVGFFKRDEGIFLRVGGYPPGREAIDGHPLLRKDPNRPEFTVFGERSSASLPYPRKGCGVAVHFYQSFPREVVVTEKVQCTECELLVDNTEAFAEHCFCISSDPDAEGHGDDFGYHSCRRVELVEERDYVTDSRLGKDCIRFQVENIADRSGHAAAAVPRSKHLSKGVPPLPREMPELVGGRPIYGPKGPWQPCVLLCTPGSRVQVRWLTAGAPEIPAKPPAIRLPAKKIA